jgi:hypothetical protein
MLDRHSPWAQPREAALDIPGLLTRAVLDRVRPPDEPRFSASRYSADDRRVEIAGSVPSQSKCRMRGNRDGSTFAAAHNDHGASCTNGALGLGLIRRKASSGPLSAVAITKENGSLG